MHCFGIAVSLEPGPTFSNKKPTDSSGRSSSPARPNADDILLGFRVARDSPERRNGIDPFHRSHFQEASPSLSEWEHHRSDYGGHGIERSESEVMNEQLKKRQKTPRDLAREESDQMSGLNDRLVTAFSHWHHYVSRPGAEQRAACCLHRAVGRAAIDGSGGLTERP